MKILQKPFNRNIKNQAVSCGCKIIYGLRQTVAQMKNL